MAKLKLFEVTLKYFICTDTKEHAQEEMLRGCGTNFASMELKEVRPGFTLCDPTDEENIPF